MTDLVADYEINRHDLHPYSEEILEESPKEVSERHYKRSPINFARQIKGKLIIVQGASDPNVTLKNVKDVKKRLDKQGI